MTRPPKLERHLAAATIVLVTLVAAALYVGCTRHGLGLTYDSVRYVEGARGLADGLGYGREVVRHGGYEIEPIWWWPPLFPAAMAIAAKLSGLDVVVAGLGVQAIVYLANALLAFVAVRMASGPIRLRRQGGEAFSSPWPAVAAFALIALTHNVLRTHVTAWSEPLFVLLNGLCLLAIARHADRPRWSLAVAAGVAAGLAYLARYAGLWTLAYAGLALLLLGREISLKRRFAAATLASVSGGAIVLAWIVRNARVEAPGLGRDAVDETIAQALARSAREMDAVLTVAWRWLAGDDVFDDRNPIALAVAVASTVLATVVGVVWWRRHRGVDALPWPWTQGTDDGPSRTRVLATFGGFALSYLAFVAVAKAFFDPATPVDWRMLFPALTAGIVAIVVLVARAAHDLRVRGYPAATGVAVALTAAVCGINLAGGVAEVRARLAVEHAEHPRAGASRPTRWLYANLPPRASVMGSGETNLGLSARGGFLPVEPVTRKEQHDAALVAEIRDGLHRTGGAIVLYDERPTKHGLSAKHLAHLFDLVALPREAGDDALILIPARDPQE